MKATTVEHFGLGSSFATSTLAHVAVLAVSLFGFRFFQDKSAFPADAIEIAVGDFFAKSGAHKSKVQVKHEETSALDFDTAEKKKTVKKQAVESETVLAQGQGGQATATQGRTLSEWEEYQYRLREQIHQGLIYPRTSKNLGETGRVTVAFAVLEDGSISDVRVAQPSAFEKLNQAAVQTVKKLARFDPLPSVYGAARWDTFVPIDFGLH